MFEHFSVPMSEQPPYYTSFPMDDRISPTSSRESSLCYDDGYNSSRRYPTSTSIAELSHRFNQHTLTPLRPPPALDDPTHRAREPNPYHQSPTSFSSRVCRRRQSINRLQCSPAHLSRISALVDDMVELQTRQPTYDPAYPSSPHDDSTSPSLSPDENEPTPGSYFGMPPLPASATGFGGSGGPSSAQHSLRVQSHHAYKIEKDLRRSASRDGLGMGKPMVKKKIRMRKSSMGLAKGCSGKRS